MLLPRRVFLLSALALLAGCVSTYRTFYPDRVPAEVSRDWRVTGIAVQVPQTLTVAKEGTLNPQGDILWEEDARGDRKVQVAAVVEEAARAGVAGLKGSRAVRLRIVLQRFHALSYRAEDLLQVSGVHNIDFTATVTDARTGEVLAGPTFIEAATPAFSGEEAKRRRAAGETQRSVIVGHVSATIAGWLSSGPDNRGEFRRIGD